MAGNQAMTLKCGHVLKILYVPGEGTKLYFNGERNSGDFRQGSMTPH